MSYLDQAKVMSVLSQRPEMFIHDSQPCIAVNGMAMPYSVWTYISIKCLYQSCIEIDFDSQVLMQNSIKPFQNTTPSRYFENPMRLPICTLNEVTMHMHSVNRAVWELFTDVRNCEDPGDAVREMLAKVHEDYASLSKSVLKRDFDDNSGIVYNL